MVQTFCAKRSDFTGSRGRFLNDLPEEGAGWDRIAPGGRRPTMLENDRSYAGPALAGLTLHLASQRLRT